MFINCALTRFLYNGKELQTTGNLSLLDYGARMYDPRLSRWVNPDPLAEIFVEISPNVYAFNNPIKMIDRFGLAPEEPEQEPIELPTVVITAPRLPQTDFGLSFSVFAAGVTVSQSSMNGLAKNGQFLGWHNNLRPYSLKYYGNQYVPAAKVAAQKANFAKTLNVLTKLKGIFATLGAVDLMAKVDNLIDKHKSGEEINFGEVYGLASTAVGLSGVPGALFSVLMDIEQMKKEAIEETFGSYGKFREIDRVCLKIF